MSFHPLGSNFFQKILQMYSLKNIPDTNYINIIHNANYLTLYQIA